MKKNQKNLKEKKEFLKQKRSRSKSLSNSVDLNIKVTSFQERYQQSIDILNKRRNINEKNYEEVSSIIKICDMNEQLMEKFLDYQYQNDFNSFKCNFLNYMFVISKEKRNEFQNSLIKMKDSTIDQKHFKENSMKTVFKELLKEIYKKQIFTMEEFDELKNSEKYYVEKKNYVFPLYKGNYETKYAYYIYLLFEYILKGNCFVKTVDLLLEFLKLIFSKDFQEHFKDKEKLLYFMYQYMFIIFFCLEMSEGELDEKYLFLNYFFETYSKKKDLIKDIMGRIKIKYSMDKDLLTINMNNKNVAINIYDYCFTRLKENTQKLKDLYNNLENPRYFSIEKCFKENKLINNEKAFDQMQILYRQILKSNVYSQCIKKIKKLNNYENPFKQENGEQIIKDFEDNTYYINIPNKIFGLTDKTLGNIYINSNIKDNESSNPFLNATNQTWTHCYEYGFHGLLMLVNAKSNILINNNTPEVLFDNDKKKNGKVINSLFKKIKNYYYYDSGDKGETHIFGDKLKILYLKGGLYISNINKWNKNDLKDFKGNFGQINNDDYSKEFNETPLSKCFLKKKDYKTEQKLRELYKKLVTRSQEIENQIPFGISRLFNK